MTKADAIFKENIQKIMTEGVFSENARPVYQSGGQANSKYVTGAFAEYDFHSRNAQCGKLYGRPVRHFGICAAGCGAASGPRVRRCGAPH